MQVLTWTYGKANLVITVPHAGTIGKRIPTNQSSAIFMTTHADMYLSYCSTLHFSNQSSSLFVPIAAQTQYTALHSISNHPELNAHWLHRYTALNIISQPIRAIFLYGCTDRYTELDSLFQLTRALHSLWLNRYCITFDFPTISFFLFSMVEQIH